MPDIFKTIPNELIGDSKYAVRLRSINSFGVPSDWSESLVIATDDSSAADTSRRLVVTEDGMLAYNQYGQLVFAFHGSLGSRTNWVKNPSFEPDTNGWQALTNSTLAHDLTKFLYGQPGYLGSAKITCSTAGATHVGMVQTTPDRVNVTATTVVVGAAYVNPQLSNTFAAGVLFYNGAGQLIKESWSPQPVTAASGSWTRVTSVGAVAPAGVVTMAFAIRSTRPMALNEFYNVDGVLLEKTSILREYFDGSTSAGSSSWATTANASESLYVVDTPYYQNSSVITEATLQTNPYPEIVGGVSLNKDGLFGYNTLGVEKVRIDAATGDISASDGTFTGSTFRTSATVGIGSPNASPGVVFNDSGIKGYSGTGTTPSFNVSTSGQMTAVSGLLGGWTINSSNLANSNIVLDSGGTITVGTGNNVAKFSSNDPNGYRFWIGHADPASAPFRVKQDGILVADGALITGEISAEFGTVGGWTVGSTTLVGGNTTLDSGGIIKAGTGNNVAVMSGADSTYRIWAGHVDPALAPFKVAQSGAMSTTSGTLAGITIGSNQLSVGTGSNIAGMRAGTGVGDVVFFAGNADPDNAPFRVQNDGTVVAEFVLTPTVDGNFIWHAGNDGAGSGMDSDLLDGQHGAFYRNASNLDTGTVNTSRIAGTYLGITQVGTLGSLAVTGNTTFSTNPTVSGNVMWHAGNVGAGSGLDADLLDGQHGAYYRDWTNITSKPDPEITVELTGTVSGTDSHTWTDLNGNVNISIATSIPGGPGSNLNADFLDGLNSDYFLNATNITSGTLGTGRLSGTYTISIIGNVTGNASGNAGTATALQNSRTIAGKTFNGTQNVTLSALTRGTYLTGGNYDGSTAVTWAVDATTTATASKIVARDASGNIAAAEVTGTRYISSVATGTAPLSVVSSTKVDNFNADYLDGFNSDYFAYREEVESLIGDILYVGAYDAGDYTPEGFAQLPGLANNYISIAHTANPSDASYDVRVEMTVPPLPPNASLFARPVSVPLYITFFNNGGISAQMSAQDGSTPTSTVTAATLTGQGFPGVGQRVQMRVDWNAATDTLALLWRLPGPDLLNDTGWTTAVSAVQTGKAALSGGTSIRIGGATTDRFHGNVYRLTRKVNGTLDINTILHNDYSTNDPAIFTTTSGHTATANKSRRVQKVTFPGTVGNYLSTPSSGGGFNHAGDLTIVVKASCVDWSPGAVFQNILHKESTTTNVQYRFFFYDGMLYAAWSEDGLLANQKVHQSAAITSVIPGLTDGQEIWVAWVLDVNNGASGHSGRFWVSADETDDPSLVTWTQLGATITTAGITSIAQTSAPFEIGGYSSGAYPLNGTIKFISVRGNIGAGGTVGTGTEGFRLDRHTTAVTAASTTMTAVYGQVLTVNRSGSPQTAITLEPNLKDTLRLRSVAGSKPHPVWSGGSTNYRHGMYWIANSTGVLDFIDSDLSGRYEIDVDDTVEVNNGDWVIAIDPEFGAVGHELGTDQPLSQMLFQYIPFSTETYIKSEIQSHREELDPHPSANYVKLDQGNLLWAPVVHNHDGDITAAILLHEAATNPHSQYLTEAEGAGLYLSINANFNTDILAFIAQHEAKTDPHGQYLNNARADLRYEVKGSVTIHEAKPDPHPQYQTQSEGDVRYELTGAVAAHEARADPHPQYQTTSEGDARYAALLHNHDLVYFTKTEIQQMFGNLEEDVLSTDGAQFSRIWVGSEKPADPGIGDILIRTPNVALQTPGIVPAFVASSPNPFTIELDWNPWPAGASVTTIDLEWSANGTTGWAAVTGSPLDDLIVEYVDTVAAENTTRYYRIRGNNLAGAGAWSNVLMGRSANNNPPPPTSLVVGTKTPSSIVLSWTAPSWTDPGAADARYEMIRNGGVVGFAPGTGTTYTFTGLVENTAYTLGVRSKDTGGLVSTTASVGPNATTTTPNGAPVELVTGIGISASTTMPEATVTWTNPTLPVDFSYLEIQVIRSSDSVVLATLTGSNTTISKTFTEITWGEVVKGRVRVVDQGGLQGPWVTTAGTATIRAEPVTGTPAVSINKTDITVTWTAPAVLPSDFTGYRLYEYQGPSGTTELANVAKSSSLTHTYDDLPYATQRRYRVKVERSGSLTPTFSAYSANATAISDPIPTSPLLTVSSLNTLTATWNAPTAGEPDDSTVYRVRLKNNAGSVLAETTVAYTATQQAVWTNQSYSTIYKFDVRLERSNGQHSSYTTDASATTGAHPDTTPPAYATVTSWKPEASYGRMVVRATMPADSDFNRYWIDVHDGVSEYTAVGETVSTPGATIATHVLTGVAGRWVYVRVVVKDVLGNTRWGSWVSYYLLPSPYIADADAGGTWRAETGGWRNDGTRSLNEIATGRTSSGHNFGCYFYGTKIADNLNGRTITQAHIEYWRIDEGGSAGDIMPLFWTHNLTGRSGDPTVGLSDRGVAEGSRLGTPVARNYYMGHGNTDGYWYLPSQFYDALGTGAARGITMYRYSTTTDPTNEFSYYMLMSDVGSYGGVPTARVNGRITFYHLG